MSNKVLTQYTELTSVPNDALFYTRASGVSYKTTLGSIRGSIESGTQLSFLDLTDTRSDYGGVDRTSPEKFSFLSVTSDQTGLEFVRVRFTDLTETPSSLLGGYGDDLGQKFLYTYDGGGSPSIATNYVNFTGLFDVPHSYDSASSKLVRVNSGATALEFVDPSSVFSQTTGFTQLHDTPSSYVGQAGKYLQVTSDGTGLEFVTSIPSSSSVKCGETLNIRIPAASSATEQEIGDLGVRGVRFLLTDESAFVICQWMKPTGFDSGRDVSLDLTFVGQEHESLNPRYYYNLYCITGTTGSLVPSNLTSLSPIVTNYIDMTDAGANEIRRNQHSFSALLSEDVAALYFYLERTAGTSGAETASGVHLNGIGLTYYQTAN